MEKDYSQETRETITHIYDTISKYVDFRYGILDTDKRKYIILSTLNSSEEVAYQMIHTSYQYVCLASTIAMIRNQMFIDTYKRLNLNEKLGSISKESKSHLETLRSNIDYQKRWEISKNVYSSIASIMLESVFNYKKTSVFEKILQVKALETKDVDELSKNSPFFEQEYNKYNIPMTKEFLVDRIVRLNNGIYKENNEKSLDEVVNFIFDLYRVNKQEGEPLVDSILLEKTELSLEQENSGDFIETKYKKVYKQDIKSMLKQMISSDGFKEKHKTIHEKK